MQGSQPPGARRQLYGLEFPARGAPPPPAHPLGRDPELRVHILQEDALLACLEAEKIKPLNAFRLWKWIINNPAVKTWAEVPWEVRSHCSKLLTQKKNENNAQR